MKFIGKATLIQAQTGP